MKARRESLTVDAPAEAPGPRTPLQGDVVPRRQTGAWQTIGAEALDGAQPVMLKASAPWGPISFVICVVLPAAACLIYLALFSTPQYVSEARFVVRGNLERLAIESIGQAAALSALNNSQEAHVVADYVRSPSIVADLSREHDLRRIFTSRTLDLLWRLPQNASSDELVRYWQRMASAEVDATTGIITVRIRAFSPEQARTLTRSVIELSEKLVGNFTQSMRAERLEQAQADSRAAKQEMDSLLALLEEERGRQDTLDPFLAATTLATLASTLRDERATLVAARTAAAARLEAAAPTLALADERIRALDEQIEAVLAAATQAKARPSSASDLLSASNLFDILQTRRELVTRRVTRAETALVQTRQEANRQQVYIDIFMEPTLGEMKTYPEPLWTTMILAASLIAIWSIAALYAETIGNRRR